MSFAFDEDTTPIRSDDGWVVDVSDRWSIAGIPNGGYLMGILLRVGAEVSKRPDPLTCTAHFLAPTRPGRAEVQVEVLKRGRSLVTVLARMIQQDRPTMAMLSTWGSLEDQEGPTQVTGEPPHLEDEVVVEPSLGSVFSIAERFRYRVPPRTARALSGEPTGETLIVGRLEFADGRPFDGLAMPLVADAFPPAVFQLGLYGWTPTLEMTVHHRARPQPGPLTCRIQTRFLYDGIGEEDVEVWDASGRLVGLSRQLLRTARAQDSAGTT
ncbi:MAG: hypothetical protein KatS3mg011_0937 [Acidimicrobiia bacterium]|nr:MAG: hypothetical protein KatS3mg011_0937 [Acidimicrobiia bacterium]